jgi:RHS repeat-associated protein
VRKKQTDASGAIVTWTYDEIYQLTGELRDGPSIIDWESLTLGEWENLSLVDWELMELNPRDGDFQLGYVYDPVGNRLVHSVGGALTTYVYDGANQLSSSQDVSGTTTYAYDGAGNLLGSTAPSGRTTYTWSADNRQTKAELPNSYVVTSTYRADGLRHQKTDAAGTTRFLYDGKAYLAETDGSNVIRAVYANEPAEFGGLVSQRRLSGLLWLPSYYHFDAVGSTRGLTGVSQGLTKSYAATAFGEQLTESGLANPFRFVGQLGYYDDVEAGQNQVRERTYDAKLGRWLSADPARSDGNLYRYVGNSPMRGVDPAGLWELLGKRYTLAFWREGVSWNPLRSAIVMPGRQIGGKVVALATTGGTVPIETAEEVLSPPTVSAASSVGSIFITGYAVGQDLVGAESQDTWETAYDWGPHGQLANQNTPVWMRRTALGANVAGLAAGGGALAAGPLAGVTAYGGATLVGQTSAQAAALGLVTSEKAALMGTIVGGVYGTMEAARYDNPAVAFEQGMTTAVHSGWSVGLFEGTLAPRILAGNSPALVNFGEMQAQCSVSTIAVKRGKLIPLRVKARRFFWDNREFEIVSKEYWAKRGGANGGALHHWFFNQSERWVPRGLRNAGWNLLQVPGFRGVFHRSLDLNTWMGFAKNWRNSASIDALLVEGSIRVGVPALATGTGYSSYLAASELLDLLASFEEEE